MKRFSSLLLPFIPLYAMTVATVHAEDLSLSAMVRSVQAALLDTQNLISRQGLPELKTVTLDLKTILKKNKDGGFTVYIASLGGSQRSSATSSVTLELVPPKPNSPSDVSQSTTIQENLRRAFVSAAQAIRVARGGQPKLNAKSIRISIAFAIETDQTGSVKILFPPFGVTAAGAISKARIQTIAVIFK